MELQILVTVVAMISIVRIVAVAARRRGALLIPLLWVGAWALVILIFWSPDIASRVASLVGIGRGADLIVYSAILVVLYLLYRIFMRLERMDQEITTLTRELALRDAHEKKDGRRSDTVL